MIQCVGLNPVFQRTLTIEHFHLNAVNRAKPEVLEGSAGKGINVARVLATLGKTPVTTGFLGGYTGERISHFLQQEALDADFVQTANATRTCTTILDPINKTHTELVEEGKPVSAQEVEQMYQVFERNLCDCQLVTISGTAPQQVPEDVYFQFTTRARQQNIPVLVDTQKQLLLQCLKAQPFLIKINREELGIAFDQPVDSETAFFDLLQRVHQQGVEWVVITHGKDATIVSHRGKRWALTPPTVTVVNPIGSGDAMLAGIAAGIVDGFEALEAIRCGVACGSANALTLPTGTVYREDVKRLQPEVKAHPLS